MNNFIFSTQTETEEELLIEVKKEKAKNLILYNDDVNSFEYVIETLVEICNHNLLQAEQCTYLIHHVGKCAVKTDAYNKLIPMCKAILSRGITATIE